MIHYATKDRPLKKGSRGERDMTERLAQSFKTATQQMTPEKAVKVLSKLSMYDENGQLKR